jgi:hypothetical protein
LRELVVVQHHHDGRLDEYQHIRNGGHHVDRRLELDDNHHGRHRDVRPLSVCRIRHGLRVLLAHPEHQL